MLELVYFSMKQAHVDDDRSLFFENKGMLTWKNMFGIKINC